MALKGGGGVGGGGEKNSNTKNTRSSLLVPCTFRHFCGEEDRLDLQS